MSRLFRAMLMLAVLQQAVCAVSAPLFRRLP